MANANGWGDGASNNDIGWGQGADNAIGWGSVYSVSSAGLTDIIGTPAVDPDAQAFITAASITDPTQQSAINQLVVDLKGYGVWTKMKGIWPFVGGTAAQHKWNLKDPRDLDAAFRLVFSGGITHSSSGVDPNGVNGTADTKMTSATLGTSSLSMWYYSRENIGTNSLMGNANKLFFTPILTSNSNAYYALNSDFQGGTGTFIPSNFSGLLGLNRTGTTDFKAWRNGASYKTLATVTGAGTEAGNVTLFQRNVVGQYTANQCAFASIGDGLTDTEAANFYTAVQTFQVTLGRSIGTQTVSDADAQAFVTNAGIVDQVEANAVNNLVIGLKADSLWTKMSALYPMVGGTSTSTSYNLKNPAQFQISWQGGVTWSSNGVQFGGVNGYGNTGIIPSSVSTLNSTHMSFYSRTTFNNSGVDDFGAYVGINQIQRLMIKGGSLNDHTVDMNSTSQRVSGTVTVPSGFFLANRETSTALRSLRNNVSLGSNTNTNTGTLPNIVMFLGALNNVGSAVNYSVRECAFASYGNGLTTTDETNLYSRVQTFNTALNRNV